jgi:predicted MFS family arabinose efflux permease
VTEVQDINSPMTAMERRATASLASIYALRMLGLFLIMPVMSIYAEQLQGSTPAKVGLAIGIYGISQAILQIPFGLVSDRIGRKKIIVFGLVLFALGSVIAALSTSIDGVILGRAVQGMGAIAGPVMALLADLTQEVHRTKAMALIGASIGISFGVAIAGGPIIAHYIGFDGIFWLIGGLSCLAILIIIFAVPQPLTSKKHRDAEIVAASFLQVLKNGELFRLNYGIFTLHAILSASFVVLPLAMRSSGLHTSAHWQIYLPVFVCSFILMIPFVIVAEKKRRIKPVFLGAIALLATADFGLMHANNDIGFIALFLGLFFTGFNLLEATLPSLISKTAPGDMRGTAMGIYSTSQFLGAGLGGSFGGWCYGQYGINGVFLMAVIASLLWLLIAIGMQPPRYWANLLLSLQAIRNITDAEALADEMLQLSGVEAVTLHFEEGAAYLKVDNQILDRERLQEVINKFTLLEDKD